MQCQQTLLEKGWECRMALIKSDLDKIDVGYSFFTLMILLLLLDLTGLAIVVYYPKFTDVLSSFLLSLIGVFIAVFFINFSAGRSKQRFRKEYLIKLSPILKRNFYYLYIDLKRLVYFEENHPYLKSGRKSYKLFLENSKDLQLKKENIQYFCEGKTDYKWLFNTYRDRFFMVIAMNSNSLPPNLALNISEIVERLDSLVLQITLVKGGLLNEGLILKNIKAIFKHFRIIDKNDLKLDLDKD